MSKDSAYAGDTPGKGHTRLVTPWMRADVDPMMLYI